MAAGADWQDDTCRLGCGHELMGKVILIVTFTR